MSGTEELENLQKAGFSTDDIAGYEASKRAQLSAAGFSDAEVGAYFGTPEPNVKPIQQHFEQSIGAAAEAASKPGADGAPPKPFTFEDAFSAGWQNSVTGLAKRGKVPDIVMPEDANWRQRLAFNVSSLAGDLPAMGSGFLIGGGAGIETGPGALVTGTAGAFAFPAALRSTMMDAYAKGEFKSPRDFLERAGGIMIDTGKGYVTGALTAMGGIGGRGVAAAAGAGAKTVATAGVGSEIATMATASRAMEGELPHASDFTDAALAMGFFHGMTSGAAKLRTIYAKTGIKPDQVLADVQRDPAVKQDVLSANVEIPKAYEQFVDVPTETPKAATEPTPPEAGTPEAARAAILSKVEVGGEDTANKLSFDKAYTMFVDDLHPIKKAVDAMTEGGEKPKAGEDPYILARLTRGAYGKADQFLLNSPFKFDTYENTGKSLKSILEPHKKNLDDLRAFIVAKRADELNKRGIESGFKQEDIDTVLGGYDAKQKTALSKTADELYDYNDHLRKYLRDAGVITPEAYKVMADKNAAYVPFYRLMDTEGQFNGDGSPKGLQANSPIKSIKGSNKAIIDPIESLVKNTYTYLAMADRAQVARQFVDMAGKTENPEAFAKKVSPALRKTTVADKEMTDFLTSQGIKDVPEDLLEVFRTMRQPLDKNEIAVFRDGQREVYELNPDVAAAFKASDKETANLLVKILAGPSGMLRAGTTLSPDFFPRNLARDQIDAFVNSKNNFIPVLDTVRGASSLLGKDSYYQDWLKSGGANAAMVSMDRRYLQTRVFNLADKDSISGKVWNVAKSPVEILRIISEVAENATRLGEFRKAFDNTEGGKLGAQDAGFQARESTLDFARTGSKTRAMNMITAFWNAQLQGTDRIMRRLGEDPQGALTKIAASITLPSILLWWANHDDPRYQDIPDWQRDNFWIVMTDDHIYRIPKPPELGLMFGSSVERFMDYVHTSDPKAIKKFGKDLVDAFVPGTVPTAAQPIIEHFANKGLFTGQPIVPADVEGQLPEYQYTPYTTELAKALGRMVGYVPGGKQNSLASPAVIENYIRGWTGGLGMYALKLADGGLRKAGVLPDPVTPASTLADIPVIKAFTVRYPSAGVQSIQDFYDSYDERHRVMMTVKAQAKAGNFTAALHEAQLSPEAMVSLDGVKNALSNSQQFIKMVWKNPDMNADEKRQLIDATYYQMINMARAGNQQIKQIDAALAGAK